MRSLPVHTVEDPYSALFHVRSGRNPDGIVFAGGLRMGESHNTSELEFSHQPVMLQEVLEFLQPVPAGIVIDATLGGGGHAEAILDSRDDIVLVGIDQDSVALEAAKKRLARFGDRVRFLHARFDEIENAAKQFDGQPVVAVFFDLGVSSHHLDDPNRGFSYRNDGPLDMRMNREQELTADEIVNTWSIDELARIFRLNGENRYAVRIATSIVDGRPISGTVALAETVASAIPAKDRRRGHPARRVFQAIRVEVNDELGSLASALDQSIELVVPQGRIVTLAYQSDEDKIVKAKFLATEGECKCPPKLPCVCGLRDSGRAKVLTRGSRKASKEEVARNPRAEPARLRALEIRAAA